MRREPFARRAACAAVVAAMALSAPAMAIFGKKAAPAVPADAPIARELEIRTYRNIPYHAQFLSTDSEGDDVTYAVETEPKHGTVTVDGAGFTYTPKENHTGSDSFTYVATDSGGNASSPASVSVTISRAKSGVTYADMSGHPAAAAAQLLAEEGIFTGGSIAGQSFFEPDRPVSRGEFLAMTMVMAELPAAEVTMTGFSDDGAIPAWAKSYASAALSAGVVRGSPGESGARFRAEDPVTRNEAAAILDRVLDVGNVDLASWYAGRETAPSWAAQAVGNLEAVSVLAAGSFGSDTLEQAVTRADAAQMLAAADTLLKGQETGFFSWLR